MIYAIGDIHGKQRMLAHALAYLRQNLGDGDRAVFLGDYIDRGEDSRSVLEELLAFRDDYPDTIFLRGNHEQMLLDALDGHSVHLWRANGGEQTLASYGAAGQSPEEWTDWMRLFPPAHRDFLRSTRPEWRAENHIFVHAGLLPSDCPAPVRLLMEQNQWDPRLWVRHEFLRSEEDFGGIVVFGHSPQRSGRPLVMRNKVGLDTAACFGGRLTVAGFDDRRDYRDGPQLTVLQIEEAPGAAPVSPEVAA